MSSDRFVLRPRGPFALEESIAFLRGFAPVDASDDGAALRLALADDDGTPLAFAARQVGDEVQVRHAGGMAPERARAHVERVLSLDVDATPLAAIAQRDPVVRGLLERYPGRRPVLFGTPFEAAVWAVLSQRVQMRQAARVKARLTEALGARLEVEGEAVRAFPAPERIAGLDAFPGVWPSKLETLRALAAAATAGDLDPAALRAMTPEAGLRHLTGLPGLGPFSAALVLIRGAGHPDVAARAEPRLRAAVAERYGTDDLEAVAEGWRPLRSWVGFLLRNAAEED